MITVRKPGICDFMAVSVVLMALIRCFRFSSYRLFALVGLILILSLVELIIKRKGLRLVWHDIFLVCFPLLMIFNQYEGYPLAFSLVYIIGWAAMYILRCNISSARYALYTLLAFSVVNMLVNWINILRPQLYKRIVAFLLWPDMQQAAITMYEKQGYLCGLSEHYSRNAYFFVAGIMVIASFLLADRRLKNNIKIVVMLLLGILELVGLMMVGKRGHLLFLLMSLLIVYLLIAPGIFRKFQKAMKFMILGAIILALIIYLIPQAGLAIERMIEQSRLGDISTGRFELYEKAWKMFLARPVLGHGYGAFSALTTDALGQHFAGVHNDYLQWLCEEGAVGFAIYFIASIGIYVLSIKELKVLVTYEAEKGRAEQLLIIWSVLFQTFMLLYSLTGLPHYDYEINTVYFLACAVPVGLLAVEKCRVKIRQFRIHFG